MQLQWQKPEIQGEAITTGTIKGFGEVS